MPLHSPFPLVPLPLRHEFEGILFQRSAHTTKIEFPKFDGASPRLCCDHCEMYLEVYSVVPALKTQFMALNFSRVAKTWLQTVEGGATSRTGTNSVLRCSSALIGISIQGN